jgi:hypothetical protein
MGSNVPGNKALTMVCLTGSVSREYFRLFYHAPPMPQAASSIPLAKHLVFRGTRTIIFNVTFFLAKGADWLRRFLFSKKGFKESGKKIFHGVAPFLDDG